MEGSHAAVNRQIQRVAKLILRNHALFIAAGEGMNTDSGIPLFRGRRGFWKQFPFFKEKDLHYADVASNLFFERHPERFWFFFGSRYNLYQDSLPHTGYRQLQQIATEAKRGNYFTMTSNLDGWFETQHFDPEKIVEAQGTYNLVYCLNCKQLEDMPLKRFVLDHTHSAAMSLPMCVRCDKPMRPYVMLKNEMLFLEERLKEQHERFLAFLKANERRSMTVLEIGCGVHNLTLRRITHQLVSSEKPNARVTLIRINPNKEYMSLAQHTDAMDDETFERFERQGVDVGDDFTFNPNSPEQMELKAEVEILRQIKNEVIEVRMGAQEAIDRIHKEIQKLSGSNNSLN